MPGLHAVSPSTMFLVILVRPFHVVRLHASTFPAGVKRRRYASRGPTLPSHRESLTTKLEPTTQRAAVLPGCKIAVESAVHHCRQPSGFNLSMYITDSHRDDQRINSTAINQLHLTGASGQVRPGAGIVLDLRVPWHHRIPLLHGHATGAGSSTAR